MSRNKNPLAEVFGKPIIKNDVKTVKVRNRRICPFNDSICAKDKADDPLGVCSIFSYEKPVIICPVRFKENWVIAKTAAKFFFPKKAKWKIIPEVKLYDADNNTAGNVDYVLVRLDKSGKIIDYGSLEVQSVYISGNLRTPFKQFMKKQNPNFTWPSTNLYPNPDYLSSSRKRLVPQILYKGKIFKDWGKKQVVCLQKPFFDTLPRFNCCNEDNAEIAWHIYDLIEDKRKHDFQLKIIKILYTKFDTIIKDIITPKAGEEKNFIVALEKKLNG